MTPKITDVPRLSPTARRVLTDLSKAGKIVQNPWNTFYKADQINAWRTVRVNTLRFLNDWGLIKSSRTNAVGQRSFVITSLGRRVLHESK